MYLRFLKAIALLSVCFVGFSYGQNADADNSEEVRPTIELEGPSTTPAALFVQDVLERAYDSIGYQVVYRDVPLARSFVEANKGELAGLRARVGAVADKYPNLVKVPFEILNFNLVLMADRRVCGACELSTINQVALTRGGVAIQELLGDSLKSKDVVEATTGTQALELLKAGKVQAAVLSDTNVPQEYYQLNHHWMKRTLAVLPDYHYLHKSYGHLVPGLQKELEKLQSDGTIARLRSKYGLVPARFDIDNVALEQISFISESWREFTDSEDATYWKILREVYRNSSDELTFTTDTWDNAKTALLSGQSDVLVGAYSHEVVEGLIKSDMHLDYDLPVKAYAREHVSIKALLGGTERFSVCFRPGYSFTVWLPDNATIVHDSNKGCRQKLREAEVDMVLGYENNWPADMNNGYISIELVESRPLFLLFRDNAKGNRLKNLFEREYLKLVLNEELPGYFPSEIYFRNANLLPAYQN